MRSAEGTIYISDGINGFKRMTFTAPAQEPAFDFVVTCHTSRVYYRRRWDQFLNEAAESANAQHAVRLAEDPSNLAQALEDVLEGRKKGATELLTLIHKIIEAQQSADILDLVVKSETVLRETLKMMGIPVPDAEGTLLAPLEGDI
jgi:hypothetical protein